MKAFIAFATLVAAMAFSFSAQADDEGEAYAKCANQLAGLTGERIVDRQCVVEIYTGGAFGGAYRAKYRLRTDSGGVSSQIQSGPDFNWVKACSARSEESGWQGGETAATVNVCHKGCMYSSSLDPSSSSGFTFYPTAGICTETDAPAPTPAGDGGDPGEGGGGDGGGTDPGGGDGGGDNGGGDGDGGGTNPGGGDGGGTGPGDGDGGGDDGGGDGGGTGPGPGPGPGEGDGDGDGPGQPGGDGDALYKPEGKTVEKLYDEFAERVSKAPIIDATKSFFEINVSASCPIFTFPATAYWDAMTFDFLCKPEIVAILQLLGWLLLAFAAFHAIKIALT
nr:attachment protein [Stenotrophomonas geniculata]